MRFLTFSVKTFNTKWARCYKKITKESVAFSSIPNCSFSNFVSFDLTTYLTSAYFPFCMKWRLYSLQSPVIEEPVVVEVDEEFAVDSLTSSQAGSNNGKKHK